MSRYDDATRQFMAGAVGLPKEDKPAGPADPADVSMAVNAVKGIIRRNPAEIGMALTRRGLFTLAKEEYEDEAGKTAAPAPLLHPLDVFAQLNEKYDFDWWDWEAETIEQTLYKDMDFMLSDDGKNLISALQMLVKTDYPFEQWHLFEKVGQAFNGNYVDFTAIQPLDPHEVALTLAVMRKIRPKEEPDDEIWGYVASSARFSGMVFLPNAWFGTKAQEMLDNMGNDLQLKGSVQSLWNSGGQGTTPAEKIQLGRLKEVKEYLDKYLGGSRDGS